jgi:hypothetical protein
MVTLNHVQDKSLVLWVRRQRISHTKNKIPLDRKELLDEIDFFAWNVHTEHESSWNQQYAKLVEMKRKTGHCVLPKGWNEDKTPLVNWVAT